VTEPHPLQKPGFFWRKARAWFFSLAAGLIIGLAVLVGLGRLLAPQAELLKSPLERQLSQALNASVRIDRLEIRWPGFLPSMRLSDVAITRAGMPPWEVDQAVVEFHWLNAFRRDTVITHLAVLAPKLSVLEQADGGWQLQWGGGSPPPQSSDQGAAPPSPTAALVERWPEWLGFSMRSAELMLQPRDQQPITLHVAEADFSKAGQRYRLTGWLAAREAAPEQVQFRVAVGRSNARWSTAVAWLEAQEISLSYWLSELGYDTALASPATMSAEAWLSWDRVRGARLDAEMDWVGEHGVVRSRWSAKRWPSHGQRAWALELRELEFNEQPALASLAVGVTPIARALAVDRADLETLHQALDPWLGAWSAWPDRLSGQIEGLTLGLDRADRAHHAQGRIEGLSLVDDASSSAIEGFTGQLALAGDRVALDLGGSLQVAWPEAFPGVVDLSSITGRILISPDRWDFQAVDLASEHYDVRLDGAVYRQATRPFIDLLVTSPRIESLDPRPLLPHRVIPPPALAWLNNALLNVGDATGHALLHFPVGLRTRQFTPGHLDAEVTFSDVDMAYANNWPVARDLNGQVTFSGQSLTGRVRQGTVGGMALAAPRIHIDQLSEAVVELDLRGEAVDANALASALGGLPFPGWADVFEPMAWAGSVNSDVSIRLPVNARDQWAINGEVDFVDNRVAFNEAGIALDDLQGSIEFDRQVIRSQALSAVFDGQSLALDTTIQFSPKARVDIQTALNMSDWLAEQPWGQSLAGAVDGVSDWSIVLADAPEGDGLALKLSSDLAGLESRWPRPFNKPANAVWPLEITRLTGTPEQPWRVSLQGDGLWRAAIEQVSGGWSVAVQTGPETPFPAMRRPEGPGLVVQGALRRLDMDAWRAYWQRQTAREDVTAASMSAWVSAALADQVNIDVSTEALVLPGLVPDWADLQVTLDDQQWLIDVDGPSLSGEVVWPSGAEMDRSIVVDLARAQLQTTSPASNDAPIDAPNLQDPRRFRPLTVLIESLTWGDLALGQLRLETHKTADGLELELIDVDGPDLRFQAQGRWVQASGEEPRSEMVGRLSSRNFNQLIQATGYQAGLRARQASVDFELDWPGTPLDFNLFRVAGGLDFELRGGNIPQASAGAGRLLGLISFNALPRRLVLDFRDVFSSGFSFDDIEGRFDMQSGMARTGGVRIASPAAVMTLTGTTDMLARTYDQSLVIEPGLGSTLPVIGGLAGGPVGAAAGLLLRTILNQPLKGVSMARYSIQGPWADPVIELVDAEVADVSDASDDDMEVRPQGPPPPPSSDVGGGNGRTQ